jgi:hypothetical protein
MAFDVKGNTLAPGDKVVLEGVVTEANENSEVVTIETAEPAARPGMKTTLAIRAASVEKV